MHESSTEEMVLYQFGPMIPNSSSLVQAGPRMSCWVEHSCILYPKADDMREEINLGFESPVCEKGGGMREVGLEQGCKEVGFRERFRLGFDRIRQGQSSTGK